jgi:hypothetical protein
MVIQLLDSVKLANAPGSCGDLLPAAATDQTTQRVVLAARGRPTHRNRCLSPENRQSALVTSLGRRQAYESRRGTNLRAARTVSLLVRQPYEEELVSDAEIMRGIDGELRAQKWAPAASIGITVKDGIVSLHGVLTDERERNAIRVIAENVDGVIKVHDHMTWIGTYPGTALLSAEDEAKTRST